MKMAFHSIPAPKNFSLQIIDNDHFLTVKALEKLLTHYGCSTVVGKKLQVSVEFLIMELGLTDQPFQLKFKQYHFLATTCWVKSIWEKVSRFGL